MALRRVTIHRVGTTPHLFLGGRSGVGAFQRTVDGGLNCYELPMGVHTDRHNPVVSLPRHLTPHGES
jgi:hypothetical protein